MTKLTRTVKRETATNVRGKPLMIELHPWGVRLREKGRRFSYDIDLRAIYDAAAKLTARAAREEKLALRRLGKPTLNFKAVSR